MFRGDRASSSKTKIPRTVLGKAQNHFKPVRTAKIGKEEAIGSAKKPSRGHMLPVLSDLASRCHLHTRLEKIPSAAQEEPRDGVSGGCQATEAAEGRIRRKDKLRGCDGCASAAS